MAVLYVVATPIGNIKDITLRALEILKKVDLILAEDTRTTAKLLHHYGIKNSLMSYHQHSGEKKIRKIIDLLKRGKQLAFVSEAGTPAISDPGAKLVKRVREAGFKVSPIPGPSALTAALSVAGLKEHHFLFLGFPPIKKRRKHFFEKIKKTSYPVVFFESRYRILKTLEELEKINKSATVVVCRELTKLFETIYWGEIKSVREEIEKEKVKGEFVVIYAKK